MVRFRYRGPAALGRSQVKNGRRLRKYSQWLHGTGLASCGPHETVFNASRCRRAARAQELVALYEIQVGVDKALDTAIEPVSELDWLEALSLMWAPPRPPVIGWTLIPTSVEEDPERWDGLS